jgi:hypothetical protein
MMFHTPSVLVRFEWTGALSREQAREVALVGMAARACGIECDVRSNFVHGIYLTVPVAGAHPSKWRLLCPRLLMLARAAACSGFHPAPVLRNAESHIHRKLEPLKVHGLVVSLTEVWRGEIRQVARTGGEG